VDLSTGAFSLSDNCLSEQTVTATVTNDFQIIDTGKNLPNIGLQWSRKAIEQRLQRRSPVWHNPIRRLFLKAREILWWPKRRVWKKKLTYINEWNGIWLLLLLHDVEELPAGKTKIELSHV
jgi:hypothetical protein